MEHLTCDLCGGPLLLTEPVRYEVRIEVKSAYDPLELTQEDLEKDHHREIAEILDRLNQMDPKAVQDQVYARFDLDLCAKCQSVFVKDPLRRALVQRLLQPKSN
ncbi:MAG: hypothetical protein HYZ53_20325 [Planctomycetes bacterium]|nr:hypothetical protein [Planctomycetota bacterium]